MGYQPYHNQALPHLQIIQLCLQMFNLGIQGSHNGSSLISSGVSLPCFHVTQLALDVSQLSGQLLRQTTTHLITLTHVSLQRLQLTQKAIHQS